MAKIKKSLARVAYYASNIALDIAPQVLFRRRLGSVLRRAGDCGQCDLAERINYYNKLSGRVGISDNWMSVGSISMAKSYYYFDLRESARYFPADFRLSYQFGDIKTVAEEASFTKSRPIHPENAKSVLMKLDKLRHFSFPRDEIAFEDKKSAAVWRGGAHNPVRKELVLRYRGHPLFDVGFSDVQPTQADYGPFLHPKEQMAYRYIISLEGVDVASNLKWIMASNSLCLMPPPNYETWFMEGRLQPGIHYVQVAPDMHDLEDKLLFYERHPDDARAIIRNANDYVSQFLNAGMERVVSILVMYKYFVATGQVEPDKTVESLISL